MNRQPISPYLPPAIQKELENSILIETILEALGWEVKYQEYNGGWKYQVARVVDPISKSRWRLGATRLDSRYDPPRLNPIYNLDHAYLLLMQAKEKGWFTNIFI